MKNAEYFEYCKRVADKLDMLVNYECYKCPHCGEVFKRGDTCPHCGAADLEEYSLGDYLGNAHDVKYILNRRREYYAIRVAVVECLLTAYIDTEKDVVCRYYGDDEIWCRLSYETRRAIDAWGKKMYNR